MVTKVRVITDGKPQLVDISTLAVQPNAVLLNIPCDISVYVKSAVRMTSGGLAINALADSQLNSNVIGIVEAKPTTGTCNIRLNGFTDPIFTGLNVIKQYFLSDTIAGGFTDIPPTSIGTVRQSLGKPFSGTQLLVIIGSDPTIN